MIDIIICKFHGKRRLVLPTKHWVTRALCHVPYIVSPFIVEFARVGNNTTDYCQVYLSMEPIKHALRGMVRRMHAVLRP